MKNFNIMGVHRKNQYIGGNCLKRGGGLGQSADLRRGLGKKDGGVVFLRGVDTPMHPMDKRKTRLFSIICSFV